MKAVVVGGGTTSVPLPSFPKFEDGTVRSKWIKEYDRVEAELLQHHLAPPPPEEEQHHNNNNRHGNKHHPPPPPTAAATTAQHSALSPADCTTVISLRHLPTNWSRAPPTDPLIDPVPVRTKKSNSGAPMFRSGSRADRRGRGAVGDDEETGPFGVSRSAKKKEDEEIAVFSEARSSAVGALQDTSTMMVSPSRQHHSIHNNNNNSSPAGDSPRRIASSNPFDLNRWTRVLDAIVFPPVQYRASLNVLGAEGWDLSWLRAMGRTDRIPSLLTLDTLRDSVYQGPKDLVLNSPRSILVMLKNGLAVTDLRPRAKESFASNDLPVKEQTIAFQHHEQRRKAVIQSLKSEYRNMCANLTLHDLIEGLISLRETRNHARNHPQHPPVSMQPWSVARTKVAPNRNNNNSNSPNRAGAATPIPTSNTNDESFFLGNNNNNNRSNNNSPFKRPNSSLADPMSSSLRGFDIGAQYRRSELKKQQEQEMMQKKRVQEDHAKYVALRRQATMEKIKEHAAQVKAKAEERQKLLESHVDEVEKNRIRQQKFIAERERQRAEHRAVIFAQSQQQEAERKEKILNRIKNEDAAITKIKDKKESQHKLDTALKHQQIADRLFLGIRHRRAAEFKKLFTVAEIADKTDRAENASVQRKWGTSSTSPERDE